MCLWNNSAVAQILWAYKADGILCVLYPEGSPLGRQHGKNRPITQLGACPTLPFVTRQGGAARCEAAGPEKPEEYSLEYIEDFFGPSTTQMLADRSPQ
jgi:hypothetical protein